MSVSSGIDGLLAGLQCVLDKLSAFTLSACKGCPTRIYQQEVLIGHTFALQPLPDIDTEAARATTRARGLMNESRLDDALRELHEARQLSSHRHETFSNLGCAYHHNGDDGSALYWYREALRRAPLDDVAVGAVAALEQRRGRYEEAVSVLVRFLQEADSSHIGILKQLAKLHQQEGDWNKAAGCFHRLLAVDPGGAEWSAQLQLCLDHMPMSHDRMQARGNEDMSFGYPELVSQVGPVDHPSSIKPRRDPAVDANISPKRGGPGLSSQPLLEAQRHLDSGNPRAAMEAYQSLLRRDGPQASEALLGIIECRLEMGDADGVLEAGRRLQGYNSDALEVNLRAAELLLAVGRGAEPAETYLSRAAELVANSKRNGGGGGASQQRLLCAQAEVALMGEDHKKALAAAAEAVRLDASVPRALILLGHARIRVAEYEAALRALRTARESLSSASSSSQRRMVATTLALTAQAHERLRQYPQALDLAQRALTEDRRSTLAKVIRGMALQQTGQQREAERTLDEALRSDSGSAFARLQLGYCLLCLGDHARATSTLEVMDSHPGAGALQSQVGAAKAYIALALDAVTGAVEKSAEEAVRAALRLHRNLSHIWGEVEGGELQNPLEAVQRLRGICDLDLTTLQAKQLLRLLARASGRADLLQSMSSLAVPLQGRGGGVEYSNGMSSRQPSAPPPNRRGAGACYDGAHGVLGSGASTPTSDCRGAGGGGRGGMLRGGPPSSVSPLPRGISREMEGGPSRGSWALQGAGGYYSSPPPRHEGGARGRSPGSAAFDPSGGMGSGSGYHRAGGRSSGGTPGGAATPGSGPGRPCVGGRPRPPSSRDPSTQDRGGGRGAANVSRDGSPSRSDSGLAIGWNELIQPEQLVFGPSLGAGGSAQVFRGSWNGQEVAIKKIVGIRHLEEMKKEINALRRLRHTRLVRFIGACLQPPQLLVVTEFMSGGSLHDRLFGARREPPLSPEQKWTIASQTTEGLSFLHGQRVVHRDLKSMNILLDERQNAKICDFGLAHEMEATHIVRNIDGEGGSPRYMAPECYDAAHGNMTEKVDIWATGCILIELFGGVLPYADCTTMAQLSARILVERRPPDMPPGFAPPVAGLIRQCVSFDASRRPSASELQYELARLSCLCAR